MRKLSLACLLVVPGLLWAAYPPQDPAASLDALLHDVYTQGVDRAYDLYMGKPVAHMAPAAREAFPKQILEIASSPTVAVIILQKSQMEYHPKEKLPVPEDLSGAYFIHFVRGSIKDGDVTERIYINVHPDHAAEVMQFIVGDVLAADPKGGVVSTKVAGASGLETRADSILMYERSLADVDWVLARLAEYQKLHANHFLTEIPAATRPRLKGVSTAAEPEAALKAGSFGTYMANTAQAAMRQLPPPADFAEFRKRVRAVMTADGVDPDKPDRLTRRP